MVKYIETQGFMASSKPTNWAGFAREIFTIYTKELPHKVIGNEVPSSAFRAAAQRPAFSVLDMFKTEALLGLSIPDWRQGIEAAKMERQQNG